MSSTLMDDEWELLASLLPDRWREMAKETGAMQRARGEVSSPDVLLQLLLMHVATGLSLKQTVARAQVQGLASLTDVALLKRLRRSEKWLCWLAKQMFEEGRFAHSLARAPEGHQLRAVDATCVQEPGATGTDWRVHYCLSLPDMRCDFYELTDVGGGETYKRLPIHAGDIVLGDRGYCHREGVAHVVSQQGDVIVRLNSTSFPLLCAKGDREFDFLTHARRLKGHEPREWPVRFKAHGELWPARFCAVRKSVVAAEHARKKVIQAGIRKQKQVMPETLESAEYMYVLTTVDRKLLDVTEILDLYRARWQIELCFKRIKSLLALGHLPKRNDESARAWIEGKLLTVMLIERLVDEARFFSPWGFEIATKEPLARIHRSA